MIIDEKDYLAHYGILRKSGRYPWGSGGTQNQRNKDFLDYVANMKGQGLSEVEIAKGQGLTTTQLRAAKTIAKNAQRQSQIDQAYRLKEKGWSNVAIGKRMGVNESSVRSLLEPGTRDRVENLTAVSNMLKDQVGKKGYIDIGAGVENHIGVSRTRLDASIAMLKEQGYKVHYVKIPQIGTGQETTLKVLTEPGITYSEVLKNKFNIQQVTDMSSDNGGRSFFGIKPPLNIKSSRVDVKYAEDGGAKADGVLYIRPGVPDVSIGKARYAQVRVAVDGTHYLKGMAVYKDDLPPGVDIQFNTKARNTGNKLDAMKKIKDDPENPFGSVIRQIGTHDEHGNIVKVTSAMNLVGSPQKEGSGEEGSWDTWSKNLSSQFLSKQSPTLARTQLAKTFEDKQRQLKDINSLTNPSIKKKLLEDFADDADSSSVHLKAASLPRQGTRVILPVNTLKENEVYAPGFRNGERVVLVRHPHGGVFEIPELIVNNKHAGATKLIGKDAQDAIGIHHKVAERLSGADFDGDTVLVIPNNKGKIRTAPALDQLKGFDPISAFPAYEGMPKMSPHTKQVEMGVVSNLITDMTIRGASHEEISRAVRHSMVVIDAEKHNLNYKESARVHGISELKAKYQGGKKSGASTLISRAGSQTRVPNRKARSAAKGGPVDTKTGRRVFEPTNESFVDSKGRTITRTFISKKLAETHDAHTLVSENGGTKIEKIYADHSNRLKALANQARLDAIHVKNVPYSPSAKQHYSSEVMSLNAKLHIAVRNRPLERQAQIIANAHVSAKRASNPDMEPSELKKIKGQALHEARARTKAQKQRIYITDKEWEAVQAGAISPSRLSEILRNADIDRVKQLATPRAPTVMTPTKQRRAEQMLASGYTQAEVADALGVALGTLKSSISRGG